VTSPGPEGLQAERTALAWTRTSLAVLVNGVLLVLKQPRHEGALRPVAALLAGFIAVAIYLVGVRRQRTLARKPLPEHVTARGHVQLVGVAVLVLIGVTALGLFL
jgi:uncharacterized membrane protein YidH (DUF202 family)